MKKRYDMQLVLVFLFVAALAACSGGGGGGGSKSTAPTAPFITATVFSVATGTNHFRRLQQVDVFTDSSQSTPIANATVTVNGTAISYNTSNARYEGNSLSIDAGATVNLSVTIPGDATYTATGTQFTTFPNVTAPTSGATWQAANANTITWTAGAPTASATYFVGVSDSIGKLVYPAGNTHPLNIPTSSTSYSIPASSLTAGSYYVFVGIGTAGIGEYSGGIPIANAAAGSGLWIGGITTIVPITVGTGSSAITGQAVDKATGNPMADVTVSAMDATSPGTVLSTTTTDSSGNFTASVPSDQSVYLHLTTSGYVNKNTHIVSTTGSLAFSSINMFTTAQGVQTANGLGQCLSATSWTDPCIQNIGWANFGAKLTGGSNAAGVTISASPSGTTIGYNNGSGVYNGASTIASPGGLPAAAGYTSTQANYAFTATNGSTTPGPVNMWLIKGELGGNNFNGF